ncbi:hypothetical protein [Jannaschia rubra]|uniref:Uncharacterized protein n=1 Tax=Jannaschia rubra TaxID=282197 RepID=A0A0M6XKD3_9RHOB|nr:hypothetical protein [Jannaschia rubra]CTQ31388.1 hypothetical protein JAN5088_00144 [Jannaschia rubra]SFF80487.1 hypothetical protein SAMN04488517_101273 [Jannaschia rubra]
MKGLWLTGALFLAGCVADGPRPAFTAGDGVTPGLASCLSAIGRADVAADPEAPMSAVEIQGLLTCTAERARR